MKPNVKWRYSVWIRLLYIIIFVIVLGELFFNNYSFLGFLRPQWSRHCFLEIEYW